MAAADDEERREKLTPLVEDGDGVAFLCKAESCPHDRHDVTDHCRAGVHCDVTMSSLLLPIHETRLRTGLHDPYCCYCLEKIG